MFFNKMHGLGNDFILVNSSLLAEINDIPSLAILLCDRRRGIGADGLIVYTKPNVEPLRMKLWNSDGSKAQMCGNGIRCLARLASCNSWVDGNSFPILTDAGIKNIDIDGDLVGVDMGGASFKTSEIPSTLNEEFFIEKEFSAGGIVWKATCVNVGNPHCVIFVDNYSNIDLEKHGKAIEQSPIFPEGINVEFVIAENMHRLQMKVWERGAGITEACGTGACASFAAACRTSRASEYADVELPGGILHISTGNNGHIKMTGPAEFVFTGEYNIQI